MTEKKQTNGAQGASLAVLAQGFVEQVTGRVTEMLTEGELQLPENYSAPNALKSARLVLEGVQDKNNNAALTVCSKDSIAHALLTMVVLGLNPAKAQCYFVVFGKSLVCLMAAKNGSIALVKRILGDQAQVWDECVYRGDVFEYKIEGGRKTVTKHEQKLENVDIKNIIAAYAVLDPGDGQPVRTEIMTMDQIMKAWQQGQTKGKSPAHTNFTDEMCRKTVVRRLCKPVINSSDDSYLVKVFKEQEVTMAAATTEAVAELEANATVMDFEEVEDKPVEVKDVTQPAETVMVADTEVPVEHVINKEQADALDGVLAPPREETPAEPEPEEEVDESIVPAPKTLFNNFIEEQELDASLARKVAANMVKLDDVRKLSNADYTDVLADMATFLGDYKRAADAAPQPGLTGTI